MAHGGSDGRSGITALAEVKARAPAASSTWPRSRSRAAGLVQLALETGPPGRDVERALSAEPARFTAERLPGRRENPAVVLQRDPVESAGLQDAAHEVVGAAGPGRLSLLGRAMAPARRMRAEQSNSWLPLRPPIGRRTPCSRPASDGRRASEPCLPQSSGRFGHQGFR